MQGSGGKSYFAEIGAKPGIHCETIKGEPCFAFTVDILNPSDEVTVTLTTIDPPDTKMAIHARAEHVIVKDISNVRNASQIVDVMLESSTGTTSTLFKMLRLFLKD